MALEQPAQPDLLRLRHTANVQRGVAKRFTRQNWRRPKRAQRRSAV